MAKKRKKKTAAPGKRKYYVVLTILTLAAILTSLWAIKSFRKYEGEQHLLTLKELFENDTKETEKTPEKAAEPKEESPKKQPAKAEKPQEKKPETLEAAADVYYYTKSFDFHWPSYSASDLVVEHQHYTINYAEDYEQPYWVSYKLTADQLKKNTDRSDDFREDPLVRTQSASLKDYYKSGYDRGHLAPAADFSWDEQAMSESFYMSNMSPQVPGFNRGIWKKLEAQVRDWASKEGEVYVVTGPVLQKGLQNIGRNKVAVPKYYYKIVLDMKEPELKAIAFLMENKSSSQPLMTFAVPIDSIEKTTGLDFFPMIPDKLEYALESKVEVGKWR
jgi:endonuclease G, mitochondrial